MLTTFRFFVSALSLAAAACAPPTDGGDDDPPGATAPAAPTGLNVELLGEGGHLTWTDASNDEDEFIIQRKEGSGAYAERVRVTFNTTQFHDEPLTAGTTYTYQVLAANDAGESASNEATYVHE